MVRCLAVAGIGIDLGVDNDGAAHFVGFLESRGDLVGVRDGQAAPAEALRYLGEVTIGEVDGDT